MKRHALIIIATFAAGCVAVPGSDPEPSRSHLSSVAGNVVRVESTAGTATERFGVSFAGRGIALAVGAPDDAGGRVVLYLDNGDADGFAEDLAIAAPNALPFGVQVAVGNTDVAVTASDGVTSEVWIASADPDTGTLLPAVQLLPDSPVGPRFGESLAVHTRYLVATDPSPDGATPGRALVFAKTDDGTWAQEATLSEAGSPFFGTAVAVWDDCAIVSSGTASASGPVYAYIRSDEGVWALDEAIFPADTQPSDGFGAAIAANDKDIFIGAPGSDLYATDSGAIYFYVHRSDGWAVNYTFGLDTAAAGGEKIGSSMAIDRQFLLAGAPGTDIGGIDGGAAYLFWAYQNDGSLGVVDRLLPATVTAGGALGEHVAFADGLAVFGNRGLPELWQARYARPPIGRYDAYTAPAQQTYASEFSVLDNDEEPDGDPMTVRLDETTANGELDFGADGNFTYTPNPTFIGTDSFYYIANDGTYDSRVVEVDIEVEAADDALCGEVLCPPDNLCYADACFARCASNAECGVGRDCFVGRCASDACTNVICPDGLVCFGGSCFAECVDNTGCGGSTSCFEGRCAVDPCAQVQCPIDYVCHGGACFQNCSSDSDCGDSACWDGRCTSDPCDGVQCRDDEVCVGGTCFLGCTDDAQCGNKQCIAGRCAADACEGISCRIGQVCHEGDCVRSCTSTSECSTPNTCQSGKCLLPPDAPEDGGCSTGGGSPSPWLLVLAAIGLRRRRR